MDCEDALRRLPESPPSVGRVLCALAEQGPLTMKDLQGACGLARRTVYGAITQLRGLGIISERPYLGDTRQTLYWVAS